MSAWLPRDYCAWALLRLVMQGFQSQGHICRMSSNAHTPRNATDSLGHRISEFYRRAVSSGHVASAIDPEQTASRTTWVAGEAADDLVVTGDHVSESPASPTPKHWSLFTYAAAFRQFAPFPPMSNACKAQWHTSERPKACRISLVAYHTVHTPKYQKRGSRPTRLGVARSLC